MRRTARASLVAATTLVALALAAAAQAGDDAEKVLVCHGTASETNSYVLISVSANALEGHFDGTEPGHGWRNAPDMLFDPTFATCAEQAAAGGGGEE